MYKILVVDDTEEIAQAVSDLLRSQQYEVETAHDAADCMQLLRACLFDVLILDWQLPDKSGIEVLSWYRKQGGNARIIMLTGRAESQDKETGLDSGADDYLTKPFEPGELLARVRAVLRRSSNIEGGILSVGGLELRRETLTVTKGSVEILLNKQEYKLLEFLMRNANRVHSEDVLITRIWNSEEGTSDALRSALKRLRKKVDPEGSLIKNIRGVGYMLKVPPLSQAVTR